MKQSYGLTRNTIDKFYTKPDVCQLCYDKIKDVGIINHGDHIIEPSAGKGVFIEYIKKLTNSYSFYDIEPDNDQIIKQDFLAITKYQLPENMTIHILGNPPFGRQSSMAKKFIKKASEFSKSISFILPKSFKKDSYKKTFPPEFHLICEIDLPQNSFTINEKDYDVPCIFQIWLKKDFVRSLPKKLLPKDSYSFVDKNNADISFRRVGFNAGHIDKEINNKNKDTHYFIKLNIENDNIDDLINSLKNIRFESDNTVGPKSISKQELIKKMNEVLDS